MSIGWRPSQLNRLLFIESSIVGLVVAFISWIMQMNDGYTVRKMV
nr:hypothetical protein [Virgibacillus sp. YIM 98842]